MRISEFQYQEILRRQQQNPIRGSSAEFVHGQAPKEVGDGGLHGKILEWCNNQWPRWKVIWARTDVKSTLPLGCNDMTVLMPRGRVVCVELKSATGKLSEDQLSWRAELRLLGHEVFVVRSLEEFLKVTSMAPIQ